MDGHLKLRLSLLFIHPSSSNDYEVLTPRVEYSNDAGVPGEFLVMQPGSNNVSIAHPTFPEY